MSTGSPLPARPSFEKFVPRYIFPKGQGKCHAVFCPLGRLHVGELEPGVMDGTQVSQKTEKATNERPAADFKQKQHICAYYI